jgi:putative oxidoreductase
MILGFMFCLHGFRLAFGLLPALAGRRLGTTMALDVMPRFVGYWELAAGILLLVGLLTRPTAMISSIVAIAAYLYGAAPRGWWPIRNGGNEVLLYAVVFAYLAVCGGGAWSLDVLVRNGPRSLARTRPA